MNLKGSLNKSLEIASPLRGRFYEEVHQTQLKAHRHFMALKRFNFGVHYRVRRSINELPILFLRFKPQCTQAILDTWMGRKEITD